jgi:probable rRNA maturation factor
MPWKAISMAAYYTIHLKVDPPFAGAVDRAGLRAAARAALTQQQAAGPAALSVLVSTEATLHALNAEFRAEDHPTDVLSFPNAAGAADDPETGGRYYGDIAISLPTARAQAAAAGHPLLAELQLLVVHGVLHLLGHDHARVKDKAKMWQAQEVILAGLAQPRSRRVAPRRTGSESKE